MSGNGGSFTIGRAAREAGVGIETIRFYERRGLIVQPPKPRTGGFRHYDRNAVQRIRFIREAQEIGFSLGEIAELLSLRADPAADCADVRRRAVAKREEVERKIAQLRHIGDALDALIARCPGTGSLEACTILDAMAHGGMPDAPTPPRSRRRRYGPRTAGSLNAKRSGKSMKTTILTIEGMHCDGCAETIQALLEREAGVRKAEASYADRQARVLHDPNMTSDAELKAAIEKAGFRAAVRTT